MTYNDKYISDNTIQRYTIVVIYFSMKGNTWKLKNNWMSHSDVCRWYGILCYHYPNNVTVNQILLNDNSVKGVIPREISLLTEVDRVDFGDNLIVGGIPISIGSMAKLCKFLQYL